MKSSEELTAQDKHFSKCRELIDDVALELMERVTNKYKSGGVDTTAFDPDHYVLAKILVTAALQDGVSYRHHTKEEFKIIANLTNF